MTLNAQQTFGRLEATVTITNTAAGHHIPTDYPGRHIILWLTVLDSQGQELVQIDGAEVPDWGGAQVGLPGKV